MQLEHLLLIVSFTAAVALKALAAWIIAGGES